jgi:hypothetical protein
MADFCVFHLVDGETWVISRDEIEYVGIHRGENFLWKKGNEQSTPIQESEEEIYRALGISKPARTLLELTPVKETHGKKFLLTPEAIAYIQFLEKETIVGMPDGNTQFHVKETKSQLEPVLAQHGIFIREVSSYQGHEEGVPNF